MPALNFKPYFKNPIVLGDKPGTVREKRKKYPIKVGDTLYLFTGMRTKKCKKFMTAKCVAVYDIEIGPGLIINGVDQVPIIRHWFARSDGFNSFVALKGFFLKQYKKETFKGVWIVWKTDTTVMVNDWLRYKVIPPDIFIPKHNS